MKEHAEGSLLSAYLDGELAGEERAEAAAHLAACEDCRLDLESLRYAKRLLAKAPRRAMPPDLIATLEARYARPAKRTGLVWPWLAKPAVWVPAGAVAAAILTVGLWFGNRSNDPEQFVPIEPLLAAHARYTAESLVPQGSLVTSNYAAQTTAYYGETQDQQAD